VDFAAEFIRENREFGDLIAAGDPVAPVPTCPGWNLTRLFRHVGGGDRWAAQIVVDRAQQAIDPRTVPEGRPPDGIGANLEWLHAGALKLTDAVAVGGGDTEVWTFIGPRPATWWVRRRLHETVVHRADAAIATGTRFNADPVIAADAISEWLDIATARGGVPRDTIHLHATDGDLHTTGEWTIAEGLWSHEHSKGDVALRGPASDLLLALTRRKAIGETAIELFGDAQIWHSWLDATPF
jgi:uncharacterized protein (TIGR03083 family)